MQSSRLKPQLPQVTLDIAEKVPADLSPYIQLLIRLCAPTDRRAIDEPRVTGRQVLAVPIVAPVGDEIPRRPVPPPGLRRIQQISHRIDRSPRKATPARSARTNIEFQSRSEERRVGKAH